MKKENRRTKMTKMLLNESLLNSLSAKPLAKITIKEICENADINRSTYYTYYSDPYDQLKKLKLDIIRDMSAYVDCLIAEKAGGEKRYPAFKALLDYIWSKKSIFQVLLKRNSDIDLIWDIQEFFGKYFAAVEDGQDAVLQKEDFSLPENVRPGMPDRYQYIFASLGVFGIIHDWIISDTPISTEALAEVLTSLTVSFRR